MQELVSWVAACTMLGIFGVSLGVRPNLYGAAWSALSRGSRVWARMGPLILGLALGALALFALFQVFVPTSLLNTRGGSPIAAEAVHAIDLAVGVLFLVFGVAFAVWAWRRGAVKDHAPAPPRERAGGGTFFAIGVRSMFTGFATLPIMYFTGRIVSALSAEALPQLGAFAVLLLGLVTPFLALTIAWQGAPSRAERIGAFCSRVVRGDARRALALWYLLAGLAGVGIALWQLFAIG